MKRRKIIPRNTVTSGKLELFGYRLEDSASNSIHRRRKQVTRTVQIVLSGALLVASLVVIFVPGFDGVSKQWAYGLTVTIAAFWLRK